MIVILGMELYTQQVEHIVIHIPMQQGCDSVHTLNLTINNSLSSVDIHVACDSFTWIDGIVYTSSNNTATYMYQTADDCDSLVTLNLTINSSNTGSSSVTACDSYTWDGVVYTTSGTYSNTYTNARL